MQATPSSELRSVASALLFGEGILVQALPFQRSISVCKTGNPLRLSKRSPTAQQFASDVHVMAVALSFCPVLLPGGTDVQPALASVAAKLKATRKIQSEFLKAGVITGGVRGLHPENAAHGPLSIRARPQLWPYC